MNIFIIPSIYPSKDYPNAGFFFKDQVTCLARNHKEHNFGISLWGQNELDNLLRISDHFKNIGKLFRAGKRKNRKTALSSNLYEYYEPRFTWTSMWRSGNINSIIKANLKNLEAFEKEFGKVDLIHAHVSYPAGYIAQKLSAKRNIPYVITEHMSRLRFEDFVSNKKSIYPKALSALNQAHRVIAVSKALQQHLFQYRPDGINVIPNMVDEHFFVPEVLNREKNHFKILAINNITHSKGIKDLLDTIARVKRVNPNISLRIVGEGPDKQHFLERQRVLRIKDEVTWVGPADRNTIADELKNCDILISASLHETFGMVLAEAIAMGKPIVCTRCGGPEDIVNFTNGVIAERRDSVDLAKKLLYVMNHISEYDPKAIRMDFEQRFSSGAVTPKLILEYKSVINESAN